MGEGGRTVVPVLKYTTTALCSILSRLLVIIMCLSHVTSRDLGR
jgi:hypothetical protein